jgi:xylulokinase
MSTLGLDIGTTGCKAAVFDANGTMLAAAYREYPLHHPRPERAELDSEEVVRRSMEVVAEAARACADDPVEALAISSQGEAFTPVDAAGMALGPAMVSSDTRAIRYATEWAEDFGVERLYHITGHTPHPLFSLFKLLWIRDNDPDLWARTHQFLCFEDLFCRRLGLPASMGYSLGGRTMLFNVREHAWDADVLGAVGLTPDQLAETVPSGTVVGAIPAATARELGLAEGCRFVAGGHDQPCNALGAGVVSAGMGMYGCGTVECICLMFDEPTFRPELMHNNLDMLDAAMPGLHCTLAYSLTGGNLLKWFRDEWCAHEVEAATAAGEDPYERILASMPAEPSSLLVLPYFTPSGTPHFDTETPGIIYGLRLTTTRGEVLRGLLEGVALEMRLNLEILRESGVTIRELRGVGGGARSEALLQLKADVLGAPITPVEVSEGGCLGMAMLARAATQGPSVTDLAEAWIHARDPVEPDPERAARYTERLATYRDFYRQRPRPILPLHGEEGRST